jgi:hypothetical protein
VDQILCTAKQGGLCLLNIAVHVKLLRSLGATDASGEDGMGVGRVLSAQLSCCI